MLAAWIIAGLITAVALAVLGLPWWLRLIDRAPRNDRVLLAYNYELPRYYVRSKNGDVDTAARWPGWDAWTVCALPVDADVPVQMIRGTLMTGLYGLDGLDNYERLTYRLDGHDAVEQLCLIPTAYSLPAGKTQVLDHLMQRYLPRHSDLAISDAELDVRIAGGRITGAWPRYHIRVSNPEAEIEAGLDYTGRRIIWWADIPGIYTHFSAFGDFDVVVAGPHDSVTFRARGAVDHIFAANLPIAVGRWVPLLYHNEVLIGDEIEGGILRAGAFGLSYRNNGGLYANNAYHELKRVRVRHLEFDPLDNCGGLGAPVQVPRRWEVDAASDAGPLHYTASRTHPPAMTGTNTNQYRFEFEGAWCGRPVGGRGYGEYARL